LIIGRKNFRPFVGYFFADWRIQTFILKLISGICLKVSWSFWCHTSTHWGKNKTPGIITSSIIQIPSFCSKIFFTFVKLSLFKQAAISLSFLYWNVIHSKQAALSAVSIHPRQRGLLFSWSDPPFIFVYKAPVSHQQTVEYWFFSWLGRSSLGFLLSVFISKTLAVLAFGLTSPDAPYLVQT